ncbi:OmpA family protein [Azohydromonas aeria]|uniref:OmpA family protein n=1 Tax=Azohydromonas aeria TaxID=2590212 RepID=UPI0012FA629F|nr:OmpA family protein [Azohydromonas aeria]
MRTLLTLSVIAALAGCSSAPKVPQASESTRRPANDPAYIEMLKARAELDRARDELALQRRAAAAGRMLDEAQKPAMVRTSSNGSVIPVFDVSAARTGKNVVFTVRFPVGGSTMALSPQARNLLSGAVQQSPLVVVSGRTDAAQANEKDARIARARAESARVLLVQLGVDSRRIRTTWQSAGDNVAPLDTADGRAANRRVEIEVYGGAPAQVALDGAGTTVAKQ